MSSIQEPNPASGELLPRAEILSLLQEHLSGGGPVAHIDPTSFGIADYMCVWDDFVSHRDEFLDYVRTVAAFFACTISEEEIEGLYNRSAKVSDLLDILAERAPRRELRPKIVLCRPCMPAAVFKDLVRAASAIKGQAVEASPSTRLTAVLDRSELSRLLTLAGHHFPGIQNKLNRIERSRSFDVDTISLFWMSGLGVAAMLTGLAWLRDGHVVSSLLLLVLLWLMEPFGRAVILRITRRVDKTKSLFVDRIQTFRDLVNYLPAEGGARYMSLT